MYNEQLPHLVTSNGHCYNRFMMINKLIKYCFQASNPYIGKLSILDDELALNVCVMLKAVHSYLFIFYLYIIPMNQDRLCKVRVCCGSIFPLVHFSIFPLCILLLIITIMLLYTRTEVNTCTFFYFSKGKIEPQHLHEFSFARVLNWI